MAYKRGIIVGPCDSQVLFKEAVKPVGFFARFRGLQWRPTIGCDEAWWFERCSSIHTFGMRFCIDVLYLSSDFRVVKIVPNLAANRVSCSCRGVFKNTSVVEMLAGEALRKDIHIGSVLRWVNE